MKSLSATRNRYVLLVDKSAFTLYVYKNGDISARYPIELGWNPFDRKERQGDGCTPEGLYEITWKRDIGSTEFHRAFLLNYPNDTDREHGRTGGVIEIHGCGTGLRPGEGGENWTAGCIALSNEGIDSLFLLSDRDRRIDVGTPVGIVYAGSLHDEEYELQD
jgi:murein L,D-transpeptidase YafK